MEITKHNDLTTLHGLRYHLTFAHAGVTKAVQRRQVVVVCNLHSLRASNTLSTTYSSDGPCET